MGIIHGELQPLLTQKNEIFILDTKNKDFSPPLGGRGVKKQILQNSVLFFLSYLWTTHKLKTGVIHGELQPLLRQKMIFSFWIPKMFFFCPLEAGVKKRTLQNPVVFLLTHPLSYELWLYEPCSTVYKFTLQYNCQQLVEMNAIENEKKNLPILSSCLQIPI